MKTINLFSQDNRYSCAVELAESTDRFGCPDHSVMILFEHKDGKHFNIATAYDRILETEKDKKIKVLEKALELAVDFYSCTACIEGCDDYDCGNDKKRQLCVKKQIVNFKNEAEIELIGKKQ